MSGLFLFTGFMIVIGTVLTGGILGVKVLNQRERDHRRTGYILNFPPDLDPDRVLAFLRATSRTLSPSPFNLTASQTMVFEVMATDAGIVHRLRVPWQKEDDIIPQLRALAPGVSATPDTTRPDLDWTYAVEIGSTNKGRPFSIPSPKDISASVLASIQPLKEGEAVLIQWVITRAPNQKMPEPGQRSAEFHWLDAITPHKSTDEVSERRAKLSEPNVVGVLRVASRANTTARAKHLIDRIKTSYNATNTTSNQWYRRRIPASMVIDRAVRSASLSNWTAQLSVSELMALVGWPIGNPNVSGLPRGASRQLAANLSVPQDGIVIGTSTFPGAERPVAISYVGGLQHTHITAGTGAGKTTLMANMAEQDMIAGHTVIVMEPKGDLFYQTLQRVPKDRIDDVIIVDVEDVSHPIGFNILQQGNSRIAASNIKNLFEHHFPDITRSVWARSTLHRGLQTLITDPRSSFVDIVPLFSPTSRSDEEHMWKDDLVRGLDDYDLKLFWQRFDNMAIAKNGGPQAQERMAAPLMDRAWIITETPEVRNIFGQSTSSFTFEDVFKEGKIVLINLSGIAQDAASLTGTFFMQAMWTAIQSLRGTAEKPAYLYLDEFQSFLRLPVSAEEMLAKSRSFKLGMRLAHQHLDQLRSMPELHSAVMNNARNKIMFQLGSDDASKMAREFGTLVTPHDFQNLRQYEAFARVVTSEGVSQPLSLRTLPPTRPSADVELIRRISREKYGRPVEQVIRDMRERRKGKQRPQSERPRETGEGW